ncbi:MAG: hypothetical protein IJ575_09870 [Selenomonadaceae bacterium]|nr:hypothetical protein [Selenomonadaceae bacterium]
MYMSVRIQGTDYEAMNIYSLNNAKQFIFESLNDPRLHYFGISFYDDEMFWYDDLNENRLNRLFGVMFFTHFEVVGEGINAKTLKDHPMLEARFYGSHYCKIPEKFSFPRGDRKKLEEIIDYSYRIAKTREDLGFNEYPMYDHENEQRQREIASRMIEMGIV